MKNEKKFNTKHLLELYKLYLIQANQENLNMNNYHSNEHDNSNTHPDYHNNSHDNTPGKMILKKYGTN